MRLFHGGPPDLRVGDIISPRSPEDVSHLLDGCPTCEARRQGTPLPDDDNDPTLIYVTSVRWYAAVYAAGYPDGALYQVEPIGDLTPSAGDPVPSWGCGSARVIAVLDRLVRFSDKDIRRVDRRIKRESAVQR